MDQPFARCPGRVSLLGCICVPLRTSPPVFHTPPPGGREHEPGIPVKLIRRTKSYLFFSFLLIHRIFFWLGQLLFPFFAECFENFGLEKGNINKSTIFAAVPDLLGPVTRFPQWPDLLQRVEQVFVASESRKTENYREKLACSSLFPLEGGFSAFICICNL